MCSLHLLRTHTPMCRDTYPETFLPELFDICLARAKERWRSFSTGGSEAENEGIHRAKRGGLLGSVVSLLTTQPTFLS